MKITPLVLLAAMRVPVLTDLFSDTLPVASMTVANGVVTLTTADPHGEEEEIALSVTDAYVPNPIVAWSQFNAANGHAKPGDVLISVQYPHTLSTTPDASKYLAWNSVALFQNTDIIGLDGRQGVQLVAVPDALSLIVRPAGPISLPANPTADAALIERMERQIVGWHKATVVDETTLSFPVAGITRSFAIVNPRVVTNIRIWGAVDLDHALRHVTRADELTQELLGRPFDQSYMFICPRRDTRLSRDRSSRSDAIAEIQPGAFIRQLLMDGYEIYVLMPCERYGGGVGAIDKAQGPVFKAVLRTFNGLRLPYTELAVPNPFVTMLSGHRASLYNRANYVHNYSFEATVYLSPEDIAPSIEVPDLTALWDGEIPDSIAPQGTVPISKIVFDPGIFQQGRPQPLQGSVDLDYQP